jgi:hypothetical protein
LKRRKELDIGQPSGSEAAVGVSFEVGSCLILSFLSSVIILILLLTSTSGRMNLPVAWFVILPPWSISSLFVLCAFFTVSAVVKPMGVCYTRLI